MQIQSPIHQFQNVTVNAASAAKYQNAVRQRRTEAQRNVIAFGAIRIHCDQTVTAQRQCGVFLATIATEAVRACTVEDVLDLVQQTRCTRATVQTRKVQTGRQWDGTIFATPQGFATAIVVSNVIGALAMHARSVFLAFVDFGVANQAFVANVTFARVRIYLENGTILVRKLDGYVHVQDSSRFGCGEYRRRTSKAFLIKQNQKSKSALAQGDENYVHKKKSQQHRYRNATKHLPGTCAICAT